MWLIIAVFSIFGFTGSLTTSLDLRGVIHGDRMAGVPLGSALGAGEVDVEGVCRATGMACQNCTMAVTCIPLPGGWLKVPLEECKGNQSCNAHLGRCSDTPVPECEGASAHEHSCEQVGIFPDAGDCRKFHLCSPPQSLPDGRPAHHGVALCPRNYGYNPKTAQCSIQLPHGQCKETPVPTCLKVGDSGSVRLSLNHYYVCLMKEGRLHPQVFICPHGWYFWEDFCRPEGPRSSESEESGELKDSEDLTPTTVKASRKATTEEVSTTEAASKAVYKVDSFFSTERVQEYAPDTFLADKFDLSNFETVDDEVQHNDDHYGLESFEFR